MSNVVMGKIEFGPSDPIVGRIEFGPGPKPPRGPNTGGRRKGLLLGYIGSERRKP
mgnify:CR=1 FL=1